MAILRPLIVLVAFAGSGIGFRRTAVAANGSWFFLLILHLVFPLAGLSQSAEEYQVKAAFLLNFARFVEWPPANFTSANDPIHICVLGSDPFGNSLEDVVKNKVAAGRHLQVRHPQSVAEAGGCEMVFMDAHESRDKAQLARELHWGVLTVGEDRNFAHAGGVVNFITRQNHIAFEINIDAADRAGLRISSKLLSLATIVRDQSPGKD